MMSEQDLKTQFEEKLDRHLTEKEVHFVSWIAEKIMIHNKPVDAFQNNMNK